LNKLILDSTDGGIAQILLAEKRKLQDEDIKHPDGRWFSDRYHDLAFLPIGFQVPVGVDDSVQRKGAADISQGQKCPPLYLIKPGSPATN